MNESTVMIEVREPETEVPREPGPEGSGAATVEVRRNATVSGVLGAAATAVAVAYLVRALGSHKATDWGVAVVLAAVAVGYAVSFLDARTPLLVADERGARVRLGRAWSGMTWEELDEVEHTPRRAWADGRLVLLPFDEEAALDRLPAPGRRQARVNRRLHGAPFAVPLALTTRLRGTDDLTAALLDLVGDATTVVEVDRSLPDHLVGEAVEADQPAPELDPAADALSAGAPAQPEEPGPDATVEDPTPAPALGPVPSPTPSPLRSILRAVRSDISTAGRHRDDPVDPRGAAAATHGATALRLDADGAAIARQGLPEADELRRGDPALEETMAWSSPDLASPVSAAVASVAAYPVVVADLDALSPRPAADPVVGPVLAAARARIGLGVDQLAERTRIRPHVIEAIEVDDFGPCGGDFYARGHLRTLARVLGVEAGPLVTTYDERYADAPIDPRRVFEAELATGAGGPIRGTRGGPNWSVLVAAAMAVVLVWSIARLLMDGSTGITPPVSGVPEQGSGQGITNPYGKGAPPVPVTITATTSGALVIIRDRNDKLVLKDRLAVGDTRKLTAAMPITVDSTDGSPELSVDGHDLGAIGEAGQAATRRFTEPD